MIEDDYKDAQQERDYLQMSLEECQEICADYKDTLKRFTDFVADLDPALYDAFVFYENLRARGITE